MTPIRLRPAESLAALMTVAALVLAAGAARAAAPSGVSQADLTWARGALARHGTLKVLAADPATGLITVQAPRAKSSAAAAGRVLLSGPGYRITAAGPSNASAADETANASTGGATLLQGVPVERRAHPIVCQGPRLLHIDSQNLVFSGDAVRAEDGCELHITNSRIVAKGFGVTARGASVHIDNSAISGGKGAISASDGAQVYARSSTFTGSIHRSDSASFHNLGGNASD